MEDPNGHHAKFARALMSRTDGPSGRDGVELQEAFSRKPATRTVDKYHDGLHPLSASAVASTLKSDTPAAGNEDFEPSPAAAGGGADFVDTSQLMLLMYIVGGREVGQVTVFKRPISIWKLDLTKL